MLVIASRTGRRSGALGTTVAASLEVVEEREEAVFPSFSLSSLNLSSALKALLWLCVAPSNFLTTWLALALAEGS